MVEVDTDGSNYCYNIHCIQMVNKIDAASYVIAKFQKNQIKGGEYLLS